MTTENTPPRKKRKNLDDVFSNVFIGSEVKDAIASLRGRETQSIPDGLISNGQTARQQAAPPPDSSIPESQAVGTQTNRPQVALAPDSTRPFTQTTDGLAVVPITDRPSDSNQPDSLVVRPTTLDKRAYRDVGVPIEVLQLPLNQACVLEFLIGSREKATNISGVAAATAVSPGTCRQAVDKLVSKGFMIKTNVKRADFQGFTYALNNTLCDFFTECGGIQQEKYMCMLVDPYIRPSGTTRPDSEQPKYLTIDPPATRPTNGHPLQSSSSYRLLKDLEPTTTRESLTVRPSGIPPLNSPSADFVLTGALGDFWMNEGLGEGQVKEWCAKWGVTPDHMRLQLEWAKFDIETNGKRAVIRGGQADSWLFGVLKNKSGSYPRPANFKSEIELRAEELEFQFQKDREARERIYRLEAEQHFQKIMAAPQSEAYRELYEAASSFSREAGGFALEVELRTLFEKRLGGQVT